MYEKYCKARDAAGMKDADVARAAGITKSTLSDWKSGRSAPKTEKLNKIAKALGVSPDYFSETESNSPTYCLNSETAEMAQKLFDNHDLRILFDAAQDATPEDLRTTYNMLMALKRKERGED